LKEKGVEKLKYLFQPLRIGSMEVKNRIVMPAMGMGFGIDEDGCVNPQLTEFYVERARGRPGMMTVGGAAVDPLGLITPQGMEILWDDKVIPAFQEMVRAVHNYDVKFGIQLLHAGLQSYFEQPVGPSEHSPLPKFTYSAVTTIKTSPRGMSVDEVKGCVKAFGSAAERCVKAGFDFLEVNAGHGYLINQFLTPYFNRRTDEYGGSYHNRIRFLLEVIREIKERVGGGIPVGVRINGDDFLGEGGWTLTDACRLAPILEKEGVNYLNVSAGTYDTGHISLMSMYREQGAIVYLAEEVKKHVSIPVMAVGRIKNPIMADEIIREGKANLVGMGRAHLADPEIVEKARKGEIADIRLCLGCARGCIDRAARQAKAGELDTAISCVVNPRVGREYFVKEIQDEKKSTARRVLVAGAGPSGLEAARRAAFAGHRVILCESKGRIGGQLRLAAMMPRRQEMEDIVRWYERQLNKLGVEIRLNTPVSEALLDELRPEVFVLATGSLPEVPLGYITGLDNIKGIELLMVDELIEEERLTGDNVLVVGGDQIGLQVADYLSEQGKTVYVAEKGAYFAEKMAGVEIVDLIERIRKKNVKGYRRVQRVEILLTDEVWVVNHRGREKLPQIDTIILASDRRPNVFLAEVAERKGIETHIIGDASGVSTGDEGTVFAAIAAGYEVGRQI